MTAGKRSDSTRPRRQRHSPLWFPPGTRWQGVSLLLPYRESAIVLPLSSSETKEGVILGTLGNCLHLSKHNHISPLLVPKYTYLWWYEQCNIFTQATCGLAMVLIILKRESYQVNKFQPVLLLSLPIVYSKVRCFFAPPIQGEVLLHYPLSSA